MGKKVLTATSAILRDASAHPHVFEKGHEFDESDPKDAEYLAKAGDHLFEEVKPEEETIEVDLEKLTVQELLEMVKERPGLEPKSNRKKDIIDAIYEYDTDGEEDES